MPRYVIPSTSRSFNNDFFPAYNTRNLRIMGDRILPRVSGTSTSTSQVRPPTTGLLYRVPPTVCWNEQTNQAESGIGTVALTSPYTIAASQTGTGFGDYSNILSDDTYNSVTIVATALYGFTFCGWYNQALTQFSLSTTTSPGFGSNTAWNATQWRAVFTSRFVCP